MFSRLIRVDALLQALLSLFTLSIVSASYIPITDDTLFIEKINFLCYVVRGVPPQPRHGFAL